MFYLNYYFELANEDKLLKRGYSEHFIGELKKIVIKEIEYPIMDNMNEFVHDVLVRTITTMIIGKVFDHRYKVSSILGDFDYFEKNDYYSKKSSKEDCDFHIKIDLQQLAYYIHDKLIDEGEATAKQLSAEKVTESISGLFSEEFSESVRLERLYCVTDLDIKMGIITFKRSSLSYGKALLRRAEIVYKDDKKKIKQAKELIKQLGLNQERIIPYSIYVSFQEIYDDMSSGDTSRYFHRNKHANVYGLRYLYRDVLKLAVEIFSIKLTLDIIRYDFVRNANDISGYISGKIDEYYKRYEEMPKDLIVNEFKEFVPFEIKIET